MEEVATNKALPQDHYALYLVLGDSESHRVICSSDRLLGVLSSVGSECFLCLKPNNFAARLKSYVSGGGDREGKGGGGNRRGQGRDVGSFFTASKCEEGRRGGDGGEETIHFKDYKGRRKGVAGKGKEN